MSAAILSLRDYNENDFTVVAVEQLPRSFNLALSDVGKIYHRTSDNTYYEVVNYAVDPSDGVGMRFRPLYMSGAQGLAGVNRIGNREVLYRDSSNDRTASGAWTRKVLRRAPIPGGRMELYRIAQLGRAQYVYIGSIDSNRWLAAARVTHTEDRNGNITITQTNTANLFSFVMYRGQSLTDGAITGVHVGRLFNDEMAIVKGRTPSTGFRLEVVEYF